VLYAPVVARLTVADHDRGEAGLRYVYPVVSRRAGGVSVGVNLNPNNACNWRCVYCQVPGLVRGKAPPVELARLEAELDALLTEVQGAAFMATRVPEGARRLNDVALSGNGEPTSARELEAVLAVIRRVLEAQRLLGVIKVVMITNGSLADQPWVTPAWSTLAAMSGEVWFKLDRATRAGIEAVNSTPLEPRDHLRRLEHVARRCPTFVQTCMFAVDGAPPAEAEVEAYLSALEGLVRAEVPLQGVLLYGLARTSHQPEAEHLSPVPEAWLRALGDRIEALGLTVKVTP
jgi:wyosine [tRNA(Phe)-imidazoG37] synthetase (radical SAM superfamily)